MCEKCHSNDNEYNKESKKRKFEEEPIIYKSGDIILLNESRYFAYEINNICNEGGMFSNDYFVFNCCGKEIKRWTGRKDYATLLDHLKTFHNMVCVKNITEDKTDSRIKIDYTIKCTV